MIEEGNNAFDTQLDTTMKNAALFDRNSKDKVHVGYQESVESHPYHLALPLSPTQNVSLLQRFYQHLQHSWDKWESLGKFYYYNQCPPTLLTRVLSSSLCCCLDHK